MDEHRARRDRHRSAAEGSEQIHAKYLHVGKGVAGKQHHSGVERENHGIQSVDAGDSSVEKSSDETTAFRSIARADR